MISEYKETNEQIMLYLNGSMTDKEKKDFEAELASDADLKKEFDEFQAITEHFTRNDSASLHHFDQLFKRVKSGIETSVQKVSNVHEEKIVKQRFIKRLLGSANWGWAMAAVQFTVLVALVVTIGLGRQATVYDTLSVDQQKITGIRMNVIFRSDATHDDVSKLLASIKAKITDGPTGVRLYTVTVSEGREPPQKILNKLKGSKFVEFAEFQQ